MAMKKIIFCLPKSAQTKQLLFAAAPARLPRSVGIRACLGAHRRRGGGDGSAVMVTRQHFTGSKLPQARAACGCACACTSPSVTAAVPGSADTGTPALRRQELIQLLPGEVVRVCSSSRSSQVSIWYWNIPGWNANIICLSRTNDFSALKNCPIFFCVTLGVLWGHRGWSRSGAGQGFLPGCSSTPVLSSPTLGRWCSPPFLDGTKPWRKTFAAEINLCHQSFGLSETIEWLYFDFQNLRVCAFLRSTAHVNLGNINNFLNLFYSVGFLEMAITTLLTAVSVDLHCHLE